MRFKLTHLNIAVLLVIVALLTAASSTAAPITGTLNITGDATVAATFLDFLCDIVAAQPCPANTGNFAVTGPVANTGTFNSLANTYGYIRDLNQANAPINSSFLLSNFITFQAAPDVVLDLTFLFPGTGGSCPPAGNSPCTPQIPALVSASNPMGLSPFNLSNTATGSSASFAVTGVARRVSTGELSPFNGLFTAQFTNTPGTNDASVAAILTQLATVGTVTSSYSAEFVATAIPEPATATLMIGALLVLVGVGRKSWIRR